MFGIYVFVFLETYSPSPIFGKVGHWTRQDASQLGRDASEIRINPLRPMVYFWQRYVAENNVSKVLPGKITILGAKMFVFLGDLIRILFGFTTIWGVCFFFPATLSKAKGMKMFLG